MVKMIIFLEDGHVIPALIHRCFLNKQNNEPFSGKRFRKASKNLFIWKICIS